MKIPKHVSYPGSKAGAGVAQWIINQMPPHNIYVEAFVGGGAVARTKKPAPGGNIAIDSDAAVCEARRADMPGFDVWHNDALDELVMRAVTLQPATLIYCDPPYLGSVRRDWSRDYYRHEFKSEIEHVGLLNALKACECMVMISGYDSALYREMLAMWRMVTFDTMTRGGSVATECLWMNYPEPTELHDSRFVGATFRERWNVTRRKRRWLARLAGMKPLERQALLDAVGEWRSGSVSAGSGGGDVGNAG